MQGNWRFVLISPAHNEAESLPRVIDSVVNSSLRPDCWIIIDDNSSDATRQIAEDAAARHPWICVISSGRTGGYDWLAYADVVGAAFRLLNNQSQSDPQKELFVGLLDTDIWVDRGYFAALVNAMEENEALGVVSGEILIQRNGVWVVEALSDKPRGGARIHRWRCLQAIGGYPRTPSPDTVTDFRAVRCGWQLRVVRSVHAYQMRPTAGRGPVHTSFKALGVGRYRLRMDPATALGTALVIVRRHHLLAGCWFLFGYVQALVRREVQVPDRDVAEMFGGPWRRLMRLSGLGREEG